MINDSDSETKQVSTPKRKASMARSVPGSLKYDSCAFAPLTECMLVKSASMLCFLIFFCIIIVNCL